MTDYERLLQELKSDEGKKYPKCCTLTKLIDLVNKGTGKLPNELYIPEYEVGEESLKEILKDLGYSPVYEEEYNSYFEQFCYKIRLT